MVCGRLQGGGCLKRVVERALLEMLGTFCAEKDEVAITSYLRVRRESCKERIGAVSGMRWLVACQPSLCSQGKGRSIGR